MRLPVTEKDVKGSFGVLFPPGQSSSRRPHLRKRSFKVIKGVGGIKRARAVREGEDFGQENAQTALECQDIRQMPLRLGVIDKGVASLVHQIILGEEVELDVEAGRGDLQGFPQSQGQYPVPPVQRPPEPLVAPLGGGARAGSLKGVRLSDDCILYARAKPEAPGVRLSGRELKCQEQSRLGFCERVALYAKIE